MANKTIIPEDADWRERVLAMATEAKAAGWQHPDPEIDREVRLDAAEGLTLNKRGEIVWHKHNGADCPGVGKEPQP